MHGRADTRATRSRYNLTQYEHLLVVVIFSFPHSMPTLVVLLAVSVWW